ncbi:hypothetical protein JW905_02905 [bacterium]|nr:hypothetical protein [candidate division CSSED10-310 bacterium]
MRRRFGTPVSLLSGMVTLAGAALLAYQKLRPDILPNLWFRDYGDIGLYKHLFLFVPGAALVALGLSPWLPSVPAARIYARIMGIKSRRFIIVTCLVGLGLGLGMTLAVLDGIPHVQDSVAQFYQARIMAAGRLWMPAPPQQFRDFYTCEFIIMHGGRVYGKYFPGFSVLLAPFMLLGVPWLLNPLAAAAALAIMYHLTRRPLGEGIARGAVLLGLASPFYWGLAGSGMSHTTCLLAAALMLLAWERGRRAPNDRWGFLLGTGLAFLLLNRQLLALALFFPISLVMLLDLRRDRRHLRQIFQTAIPAIAALAILMGYNYLVNGGPFITGYTLHDPRDRIGFGPDVGLSTFNGGAPPGHDLHKALANTRIKLLILNENLFGWPSVGLLFFLIAVCRRRATTLERILLAQFILTLAGFALFWHDGICFGARHLYENLPGLLILSAVGIAAATRWRPWGQPGIRGWPPAVLFIILLFMRGMLLYTPRLLADYADSYWNADRELERLVTRYQIDDAVIFVNSSNYLLVNGNGADYYNAAFLLNDISLLGPVLYVRDLGDERNRLFFETFPRAEAWLFTYNRLFTGADQGPQLRRLDFHGPETAVRTP